MINVNYQHIPPMETTEIRHLNEIPFDPNDETYNKIGFSDENNRFFLDLHDNDFKRPIMPRRPKPIKIDKSLISVNNIEEKTITSTGVNAKYPSGINGLNLDRIEMFVLNQIKNFKSTYKDGYTLDITYDLYESDGYIGVLFNILTDTMGAHPNTNIETFTIDCFGVRKRIKFDDYDKISSIAKATLKPELEKNDMYSEDIFNEGLAPMPNNFKYVIEQKDSYIFFFPQYQVAPYAAGIQQVKILKTELKK